MHRAKFKSTKLSNQLFYQLYRENVLITFDESIKNQFIETAQTAQSWFTDLNEIPLMPSDQKKFWDAPVVTKIFSDLPRRNLFDKARLLAVSERECGDWLSVVLSSNLGTFLDPETLRIAIPLRHYF